MLEWKRFEDETPTERRALVTLFEDNGILAWNVADGDSATWELCTADEDYTAKLRADMTPAEWRQVFDTFGITRWAYVDPPEDM